MEYIDEFFVLFFIKIHRAAFEEPTFFDVVRFLSRPDSRKKGLVFFLFLIVSVQAAFGDSLSLYTVLAVIKTSTA